MCYRAKYSGILLASTLNKLRRKDQVVINITSFSLSFFFSTSLLLSLFYALIRRLAYIRRLNLSTSACFLRLSF